MQLKSQFVNSPSLLNNCCLMLNLHFPPQVPTFSWSKIFISCNILMRPSVFLVRSPFFAATVGSPCWVVPLGSHDSSTRPRSRTQLVSCSTPLRHRSARRGFHDSLGQELNGIQFPLMSQIPIDWLINQGV